eukprot:gene3432-3758_t
MDMFKEGLAATACRLLLGDAPRGPPPERRPCGNEVVVLKEAQPRRLEDKLACGQQRPRLCKEAFSAFLSHHNQSERASSSSTLGNPLELVHCY